jgi:pSer/pThr/pTyr-binding forkhead associated (FHA) protein
MAGIVKVCPCCGHHNEDTANWCEKCPSTLAGADRIDPDAVEPSPEPPGSQDPAPVLRLELASDPARAFSLRSGQTLGARDHAERPDVVVTDVPDEDFISGRHLAAVRHGQDWFVRHVGRTNYIVVDGKQHSDSAEEIPVRDGSSLFLTYTEFIVRTEGSS